VEEKAKEGSSRERGRVAARSEGTECGKDGRVD
jgi:hypothetical protein